MDWSVDYQLFRESELATGTQLPPILAVGTIAFHRIPEGWQAIPDLGTWEAGPPKSRSSVIIHTEDLPTGTSLTDYVAFQVKIASVTLRGVRFRSKPYSIVGTDRVVRLIVELPGGLSFRQEQLYILNGSRVSIITATLAEASDAPARLDTIRDVTAGLRILKPVDDQTLGPSAVFA